VIPLDLRSVGLGSPLGDYFQQFWLPICATAELPPGAERPVRAQLLEERLVAFRDGQGRLGLIYGLCPHARGDLFYSTIEDDGIRCNYHGWKFDVHGTCLETPMHPDGSGVDTLAFSVAEHAGLIWGYLGEDEPPKLPDIVTTDGLRTERRTRPWLETVLSELLAGFPRRISVQVADETVRVASEAGVVATFTPPYLVTREDPPRSIFVLPASEKATTLLGGVSDGIAVEGDTAPIVREAVEDLMRSTVSRTA
jgi:nitrite reductase/ring-hydroxylating ferredoxin subunit